MNITGYEYKGYRVTKIWKRWIVSGKGYEGTHKTLADCKSFIDYLVKEKTK